jgi:hypothetical protein
VTRRIAAALALGLALGGAALAGCGKYGPPVRSSAPAAGAPAATGQTEASEEADESQADTPAEESTRP